jgi:hypothetical protein
MILWKLLLKELKFPLLNGIQKFKILKLTKIKKSQLSIIILSLLFFNNWFTEPGIRKYSHFWIIFLLNNSRNKFLKFWNKNVTPLFSLLWLESKYCKINFSKIKINGNLLKKKLLNLSSKIALWMNKIS